MRGTTSTPSGKGWDTRAKTTIAYVLPSVEAGGTENHVLSLARGLDRSRFDPFLVTTAGGGSLYEAFRSVLPVTVMGDPARARPFRASPRLHFRAVRTLLEIFRERRPGIVHAYLPSPNVLAPVAARMAGGCRVITSKRSLSDYMRAVPPIARATVPVGNLLSDVILVNSDAVRRDVERTERFWGGKIRKIYNGIDPIEQWPADRAASFREREGIPAASPVVVCVSNFFPYKGHADLIAAGARVAAEIPGVLFLLIGRDAGALEACREAARELGVEGSFRFAGPRRDVPDLLRAADLFVHPSHQEGFSNAVLEAMAAGLPVVACDVGGNPEAVGNETTGLIVPPRDPATLAGAIVSLLKDPARARAMGEAGRRRVLESFTLDGMVRAMEELYDSLAAAPAHR